MSMCPTWRAVSSITWVTTQRSVVGSASLAAARSNDGAAVQHGVGGRRLGPVEGDDLVDRPAVGQLEHVLAPGHVHRLTHEEDPHPEPLRVAEVHDDRTERVRVGRRTPAELVRVEVLELEDRALPQVGQPRAGAIVLSSAGSDSAGRGTRSEGGASRGDGAASGGTTSGGCPARPARVNPSPPPLAASVVADRRSAATPRVAGAPGSGRDRRGDLPALRLRAGTGREGVSLVRDARADRRRSAALAVTRHHRHEPRRRHTATAWRGASPTAARRHAAAPTSGRAARRPRSGRTDPRVWWIGGLGGLIIVLVVILVVVLTSGGSSSRAVVTTTTTTAPPPPSTTLQAPTPRRPRSPRSSRRGATPRRGRRSSSATWAPSRTAGAGCSPRSAASTSP